MKKLIFILVLLSGAVQAEITTCTGKYALCAASTCKATGKTITANSGISYPEVVCKCPILDGKSIADTTMGNMEGSCAATDSNHVWSLFAPKVYYPQEAAQTCDASLNQGARASNCFSWNCAIGPRGIADCKCPMGQEPPATTFLTEAGQGNPEACYQHPVSLPVATELMELKE
jgi:hypothetical protein